MVIIWDLQEAQAVRAPAAWLGFMLFCNVAAVLMYDQGGGSSLFEMGTCGCTDIKHI